MGSANLLKWLDRERCGAYMSRAIITLTTDFGLTEPFVGIMKGVILSINPEAETIDISHGVSSHDILDGALTFAQSHRYFPSGTIHVVVVDPGVGSSRRPILVRTSTAKFVAPDNGVLSLAFEDEEILEVRHITADHYFLKPVSHTFHGRDVFAPVAAWLSKGTEPGNFGEIIHDYMRLALPKPRRVNKNQILGMVLRVDKFGDVMTNIAPADVPELFSARPAAFKLRIDDHEITRLETSYAEGRLAEPFAILGSAGFLEVAVTRDSAARMLNVSRGAEVRLELG